MRVAKTKAAAHTHRPLFPSFLLPPSLIERRNTPLVITKIDLVTLPIYIERPMPPRAEAGGAKNSKTRASAEALLSVSAKTRR